MITIAEIMMIREAVASTALENGWDKEKQSEVFNQTVFEILKARTKVSKKKRHK